ncbi:hypothetical protein IJS77_04130 [bacterium]|nr:hypothetical protein [bacterium]
MINSFSLNFKSRTYNFNSRKNTVKFCAVNSSEGIESLNIPNIHSLPNCSARGECLYHKNNKSMLPLIRNYGINQIIDLKTADFNENFRDFVRRNNMDYHAFPIDAGTTPTRQIINSLPSFFEQINKGHYYIACAQGMHRTDIALSINYVFNPQRSQTPPILYGHRRRNGLRTDDIVKRLNNIFKELTDLDKIKIGYKNFDENIFKALKKMLFRFNL